MLEKFLKPKSPQDLLREEYEKKYKKHDPSKRRFLKKAGIVMAAAGVALVEEELHPISEGFNKIIDNLSAEDKNDPENGKDENADVEKADKEGEVVFESDFIEMEEQEKRELKRRINPSLHEKFLVTTELVDFITTYWISRFKEQDEMSGGVMNACKELMDNKEILDQYFLRDSFPPEMVYLAIPESNWRPKVVSRSGAIGCYQIMPATAKKIYRRKGWDENPNKKKEITIKSIKDGIISKIKKLVNIKLTDKELGKKVREDLPDIAINAEISAYILEELFNAAKESPDQEALALAGYNGGFFWEYRNAVNERNKVTQKKEKMTYGGFLKMLENKIETKRIEILNSKFFAYTTKEIVKLDKNGKPELDKDGKEKRRLETIEEIALRYKVPVSRLIELNAKRVIDRKSKREKFLPLELKKGKKLVIPYNYLNRESRYSEEISGFLENLQYPSKLWAILDYLKIRPTKKFAQRAVKGTGKEV